LRYTEHENTLHPRTTPILVSFVLPAGVLGIPWHYGGMNVSSGGSRLHRDILLLEFSCISRHCNTENVGLKSELDWGDVRFDSRHGHHLSRLSINFLLLGK
jgi:hypothetical protein